MENFENSKARATPPWLLHAPEGTQRCTSALLLVKGTQRSFFPKASKDFRPHPIWRAMGAGRIPGMWSRSLGGSGASFPQISIPPGLDNARPTGALSHLCCSACALWARKSLEGTLKFIAHSSELTAIALRCPEIGGSRARASSKRAKLLLHPFIFLSPRWVRTVATPGLHSPSASMMTVIGCMSRLLLNDAPQETWGQVGTWLVLSEARAQAPICSTSVFLLTRLKLWDLEHTLGCWSPPPSSRVAPQAPDSGIGLPQA